MTEGQIKQKAENVYIRCFDDDFKYTGVLHALEICAEEVATEATKELQEENERLAKHIIELQKDKGRLIDELTDKSGSIHQLTEQLAEQDEQLVKAKEIIREMFQYIPSWTGEKKDKPKVYAMPDHLREKAEAFLKE